MEVRLIFDGDEIAKKLKRNLDKAGQRVRAAMQGVADTAAANIKSRGAADIAAGGNFGGNWQNALQCRIDETQRTIRITTSMEGGPPVSYWRVFEYGAVITAHNPTGLLTWPNTSAFSIDGKVPAFISKPSVTIPKKFHLEDIVAQVAKELKQYYAEQMHG